MRILIFFIILTISLPVFGQRTGRNEEEVVEITYDEGIIYALPRTGIEIQVTATEELYIPGPYVSYANDLLGIRDLSASSYSSWEISDINIDVFSEPDPAQVYKTSGNIASLISLSEQGVLKGINSDYLGNNIDRKIATGKFLNNFKKDPVAEFFNLSDTPFIAPGDSTNGFRTIRIGTEEKAVQAAARIFECRIALYEITAGLLDEFHPDGEAYKQSINELKSIEEELLALFTGEKEKYTYTYVFKFIPEGDTRNEVVFRFSEQNGVLDKTDVTGKPVMINIENITGMTGNLETLKISQNPNAGESGIYYRIPGTAEITLFYDLKTIATTRTTLTQFGDIAPIPEELLNGNYSIEISSETGTVKNISSE